MLKTAASALVLLLCAQAPAVAQTGQGAAASAAVTTPAQSEDARLAAFFDEAFKAQIALSPETLTFLGMKDRYDELGDYTDAANKQGLDLGEAQLARMKRDFDVGKLSEASKLSYRLFENSVVQGRDAYKWRWRQFPATTEGSVAGQIPVLLINAHQVETAGDARAYISRLKAVERVMRESADDLKIRADKGVLAPSFVYAPVEADARRIITGAPFTAGADAPLWADFKSKVDALKIPDAEKAGLKADAEAALRGPFKRGYETFAAAVAEVGKRANSTDGVWRLPDGDAFYASQVKASTTTDLTPDQIHQTGLAQVARIHAEMEVIKAQVGFKGTLSEFFTFIKTDPQFHYPNTAEGKAQYLKDSTDIIANYMAIADTQFSRLPKARLEVKAVEPFREKTAPIAFYNQPPPDGSRPGIYYNNLSDMGQVLKPQVETIAYHEGAPGHHFQLARAIEQEDLPMFRQQAFYGAYIEGWGLYAERLAKEGGKFQDPYSSFGQLSSELWRAVRLVLDTGIHSKRWSRDQAIKYMTENTLLSERDITKEVNRYIANPGQATSYMVGQLKIFELRDRAKAALGPRFDLKAFHEVVLSNGAVPLDVLEEQVDGWIARTKAA